MDLITIGYAAYSGISVLMTVWVGRTLFRNGRIFLVDTFAGNAPLADAVNHLLVVGFYLLNIGFIALFLRSDAALSNQREVIEHLSWKVGIVLLVLGVMHLLNVYVFSRMRRRALLMNVPPPVSSGERTTIVTPA